MSVKCALFALVLSVGIGLPSEAHDIYSGLTDSSGRKCCDEHDCRPAPYRVSATGVEMFAYGSWIVVPANRIQYRALTGDTGETRGGHWCGLAYQQRNGRVIHITQCAILPPTTAALVRPTGVPGGRGVRHVP